MDQSTLVSRVATRLNIDSNDPLYSSLTGFVDEAIHYLETGSPDGWPWMRTRITTTVTTGVYTFTQLDATQTISKVLSVKVGSSTSGYNPLELRSADEIDQLYPDTTQTGLPESYLVEGSTLRIYPTPDSTYTAEVRVVVTEADLGGSSSTPSLPVVFHTAIIDAALLFAYQALNDDRKTATQESRVAQHVQRMRTYGQEYESSPRIRVREWLV